MWQGLCKITNLSSLYMCRVFGRIDFMQFLGVWQDRFYAVSGCLAGSILCSFWFGWNGQDREERLAGVALSEI